jgi:alpha/beta superfamily hydrolase
MIGLGVPARLFENYTLQDCHKPKLFVHGSNDEIAPYDLATQWFEQVPAPKRLVTVENADHFFQGHLDEVQQAVASFVQTLV